MIPVQIPAPPTNGITIGNFTIYFYAICILVGIMIAFSLSRRRFTSRGGNGDRFDLSIFIVVIVGIIGARAYHVITDHQLYFGPGRHPWQALNLRNGGLGIMGGVILGGAAAWFICRHYRFDFASFADVLAPGLLFAQAAGRLGNWFNQELFGRPTTLPWGLYVDPSHRPQGYQSFETFHPTFAYEMIWNALGGFVLLWLERRFRLGRGKLFACYVIWYTFGRSFIEFIRIDPANHYGGWRINNLVSFVFFLCGVALLCWLVVKRLGTMLWPFGFAAPGHGSNPVRPCSEMIVHSSEAALTTDTAEEKKNPTMAENVPIGREQGSVGGVARPDPL